MNLGPTFPGSLNQTSLLKRSQVAGDGLPRHGAITGFKEPDANLEQTLMISFPELVENGDTGVICQCLEDRTQPEVVRQAHTCLCNKHVACQDQRFCH